MTRRRAYRGATPRRTVEVKMIYIKAILIWLLMVPLSILNGGFRIYIAEPLWGNHIAQPLSGIVLSVLVFAMAYILMPKIGKCKTGGYILIGLMWSVLANLFDLLMTIAETGQVSDFLIMYDIATGNLWSVVVIVCFLSPLLTAKIKNLI